MSVDGVNGFDGASRVRGVQGAAPLGGVAAALATQPRYDFPDSVVQFRRSASQKREEFPLNQKKDDSSSSSFNAPVRGDAQQTSPQSSTFVTQSLAQDLGGESASGAVVTSRVQAGIDAYAKAVEASSPPGQDFGVEFLTSAGASLSSSHNLDLAV